jgi:hypothetical protein
MEATGPERPATLADLLALDASRRVVGIAGGLVPLEALAPQSWDFSAPTLVSASANTYAERALCPTSAEFAAAFYQAYPDLEGVPLDGLLIAGSSVGQFLPRIGARARRAWTAADVDIFVYGHASAADSSARVEAFIRDLDAAGLRRAREGLEKKVAKALRTLKPPSQGGTSIKDALSEQDTCPAAAGADAARWACGRLLELLPTASFHQKGDSMLMGPPAGAAGDEWDALRGAAPRGVQAWARPHVEGGRTAGSITIARGSAKFQLVLRHYAEKSEILHGFDIGASAAGFDGAQVWLTELGRFAYERGYNVVDTTRRSATYEARLWKYARRGFDLILPGLDVGALPRRNLKYGYCEVADLPHMPFAYKKVEGNRIFLDRFVKVFGPASDYDLSEETKHGGFALAYMNLRRLANGATSFIYSAKGPGFLTALDVLRKPPHLSLRMLQRLYDQFRESSWDGARLNVRTLARYAPAVPVREILEDVYVRGQEMGEVLDRAFAAQREVAVHLWNLHIRDADHAALPWVTENPGGQGALTGSLNPIIEDPGRWYGEYYLCGSKAS